MKSMEVIWRDMANKDLHILGLMLKPLWALCEILLGVFQSPELRQQFGPLVKFYKHRLVACRQKSLHVSDDLSLVTSATVLHLQLCSVRSFVALFLCGHVTRLSGFDLHILVSRSTLLSLFALHICMQCICPTDCCSWSFIALYCLQNRHELISHSWDGHVNPGWTCLLVHTRHWWHTDVYGMTNFDAMNVQSV